MRCKNTHHKHSWHPLPKDPGPFRRNSPRPTEDTMTCCLPWSWGKSSPLTPVRRSQRRYLLTVAKHILVPSTANATGSWGRGTSFTTSHLSTPTMWIWITFLRLAEVTICTCSFGVVTNESHTSNMDTCWIFFRATMGSKENMLRAVMLRSHWTSRWLNSATALSLATWLLEPSFLTLPSLIFLWPGLRSSFMLLGRIRCWTVASLVPIYKSWP